MKPMVKKTDRVRDFVKAGNFQAALRIAAKFRMLSKDDKKALVMAHECQHSPEFYVQVGMNPDELKQKGIAVLMRLYG